MSEALASIDAKLRRAERHMSDFHTALKEFAATEPVSIERRVNRTNDRYEYCVLSVAQISDEIASIAADALNNLRSALDYIAFHLVLRENNAEPNWRVYFPIADSRERYANASSKIRAVVREEIANAVDATESFRGGRGDAIWRLNELNRMDKHHRLLDVSIPEIGIVISDHFLDALGDDATDFPMGDIFLRTGIRGLRPRQVLYSEPTDLQRTRPQRFIAQVSFTEPWLETPEPASATLAGFMDYTSQTVDRFRPYLS